MSRWAGARRESCESPLTTSVAFSRSRASAPRAALDLRAPLRPGAGTGAALAAIRSAGIPGPGEDRHLAPELEAAERLIATGELAEAVEAAIGELR